MIQFVSIKVANYKSIEYAELHYHRGVWLVQGDNKDTTFKSNGAGKSTILEAIQQCLYNKNIKGIPIEDTYNRVTKKGYRIILRFNVNNDRYRIDNNREAGTYDVYKNDIAISKKGITENLKLVQSIIGFDFNAFTSLTYISHQNVVTLLDSFTSSNLMKVLLDFDSISNFESKTKEAFSESKSKVQFLLQETAQLQDTQKLTANFSYSDLTPLYKHKQAISDKFLESVHLLDVDSIGKEIQVLSRQHSVLEEELNALHKKAFGDSCPTCGQDINQNGHINKVLAKIEYDNIAAKQEDINIELQTLTESYDSASAQLVVLRAKFDEELQNINSTITIGEYKNKLYEETKDIIESTALKIQQNKTRLTEEYFNQDLYDLLLKTIKAGKLHKDLLDNFAKVLNHYIDDYTKYMSISYLNIKAKASKIGMDFVLYDNRSRTFIDINTLSGGELTRIRVIVLMAMLKTISTLTRLSTNILVLDEALDTLDASAADDLSSLFQYLIDTENKFIALVSHGAQLNEIEFKGTITAIKDNGSTCIVQRND